MALSLAVAKSAIDILYSPAKPKYFAGEICEGISWGVSQDRLDKRLGIIGERFAEDNPYLEEAMGVVMRQWEEWE